MNSPDDDARLQGQDQRPNNTLATKTHTPHVEIKRASYAIDTVQPMPAPVEMSLGIHRVRSETIFTPTALQHPKAMHALSKQETKLFEFAQQVSPLAPLNFELYGI